MRSDDRDGAQDPVMDLWLVRHGEAVPETVDVSRPLSGEGRRAIAAVASALSGRMGRLDLVAHSGKRRARETSEILGEAAGYPPGEIVATMSLSPNAEPEAFLAFLEEHGENKNVLCVGHLPSIARTASFLLSPGDPVRLVFGPGSVCRIRLSGIRRGAGELVLFP